MAVFHLTKQSIKPLPAADFAAKGLKERGDLQRHLRANIEVVASDLLVIAEEFSEWDESKRRIDLLAVDRDANLVVIELKRDEDGGHMDLQAIRYAAMVSSMTFTRAVEVYQGFLDHSTPGQDASGLLLNFLKWDEPREDGFARDVRIILVAADFSKELTTSVLWLNERDLDVSCVRLRPYAMGDQIIIDAQQVLPLPEAEAYMVGVKKKATAVREAGKPTGYWFMNVGDGDEDSGRSWGDCRKYGFMSAGGGPRWLGAVKRLKLRDPLFAYATGSGYVGYGEVVAEAVPLRDFVPPGQTKRYLDLPHDARPHLERLDDLEQSDWCTAIKWFRTEARDHGVLKQLSLLATVAQIKRPEVVAELLKHFGTPSENG